MKIPLYQKQISDTSIHCFSSPAISFLADLSLTWLRMLVLDSTSRPPCTTNLRKMVCLIVCFSLCSFHPDDNSLSIQRHVRAESSIRVPAYRLIPECNDELWCCPFGDVIRLPLSDLVVHRYGAWQVGPARRAELKRLD